MAAGVEFPAFLRLEYQPSGDAGSRMLADVEKALAGTETKFRQSSAEIARIMQGVTGSFSRGSFKLDIDLSSLRQAASEANSGARSIIAMRDAAVSLAAKTGDTSEETRLYIQALRAQAVEAVQAKHAADAQVETYSRLQKELSSLTAANTALAQSYRDTYLEQARAVNAAHAAQQAINSISAPGLTQGRAIDNGAGFGALEEMVRQQEMAAKAQARYAASAENLRQALDPALAIQRRFDDELSRADQLLEAGAISQREYARAVELARSNLQSSWSAMTAANTAMDEGAAVAKRGTDQYGAVTNSVRANRVAMTQLGQQMQDSVVQWQMGTSAMTIFTQQVPQAAFALSGLQGRVGAVAGFLAGPWGAAIFAATAILGPFIASLFSAGDESDNLGKKSLTLTDALSKVRFGTQEAMTALQEYNAEQDRARKSTEDMIQLNLDEAESRLKNALATREQLKAEMERTAFNAGANAGQGTAGAAGAYASGRAYLAQANLQDQDAKIADLNTTINNLRIEDAKNAAEAAVDPIKAINRQYDALENSAIRAAEGNKRLTDRLKDTLAVLKMLRNADLEAERKRNRKSSSRSKDPTRETQRQAQLEEFGSPMAAGSYTVGGGFGQKRGNRTHGGLDLRAPVGTPVYATQDGVVRFAADAGGGYGNLITIGHGGGTETRYAHLSKFNVADGAAVRRGDIIGYSGGRKGAPGAGNSTGPHLHYEVWVNGKKVDPSKGKFPMDASKVAEEAERAAQELRQFGDRSAERIQRINEAFDEQPKLIDRANQATRELDDTIKDLATRRPEGWTEMIVAAQQAKGTIQDALVRPFTDMREESEKRLTVERLLTAGREDEAEALQRIWQLEQTLGPLTEDRKNDILDMVRHEREVTEELRRRQDIIGAYLDATRSVKQELVSIFSGNGSFANLGQVFKNLRGQMIVEKLFGSAFRDFDKWVKGQSGLSDSVDYFADQTTIAGDAALDLAQAFREAAAVTRNPTGAGSVIGSTVGAAMAGANDNEALPGDIVVSGTPRSRRDSVMTLSPERYFAELTKTIAVPLIDGLNEIFGTKFFTRFSGVLSGAMNGYLTGGPTGGVLGALQGISGLPKGISDALGGALKGAQTGTLVAGIGNAFGLNMSSGGAQLGGALGSLIPVPGGDIIGSIAGGILGKLFGKRPRGGASVTNSAIGAHANDAGITESLNATGGGIQDAIKNIADALGASVGAYSIGIGRYKDYYQVSRSANDPRLGNSYFGRDSKDAVYDGLDAEAAMAAAIGAVLSQGAIRGISAASQKILTSGASKDLQAAIEKAVLIESIPKRLKALTDPVGAAIDDLNREFEKMVEALREGGATAEQFAQAQKLYELERARAVKSAIDQVTGSLQGLYDSLTVGNDALSLRDRRSQAMALYNPLAARVAAGDTTAYDDFAEAARALLDIERQISGSQSGYFDLLKQITDLTKSQLDAQTNLITAANNSDSPFANNATAAANDNQGVIDAIGQSNDLLNAINQNLGTLILMNQPGGSSFTDGQVMNF